VYTGSSLPERLSINRGELADGAHVLTVRAVADSGRFADTDSIRFVVENLEVLEPAPGARVRHDMPIRIDAALPPEAIDEVHVEIDGESLYRGSTLPDSLSVDTFDLEEGFHKLTATV